jgi:hypothetical protein
MRPIPRIDRNFASSANCTNSINSAHSAYSTDTCKRDFPNSGLAQGDRHDFYRFHGCDRYVIDSPSTRIGATKLSRQRAQFCTRARSTPLLHQLGVGDNDWGTRPNDSPPCQRSSTNPAAPFFPYSWRAIALKVSRRQSHCSSTFCFNFGWFACPSLLDKSSGTAPDDSDQVRYGYWIS